MPRAKLKKPPIPKETQKPHSHVLRRIVLMLPAVLSIGWIYFVKKTSSVVTLTPDGIFLAPIADQQPLILSLVIFTIGYAFFLTIMFAEDIKAFILRHAKKV